MRDESTVKLYAAAFLAYREIDGQLTLRVTAGLVIAFSDDEAQTDGMDGARAAFPESEDWKNHEVFLTEVPRRLALGHYLVKWEAEPAGQ
jgi:hypothetical protein